MSNKHEILRLPCVIKRTGLPRSTIYAYIEQERFPAPIKIGVRNVGWLESEITEWLERRVQETRRKASETKERNHE